MATESAEARAEATREATAPGDESQLARTRDADSVTDGGRGLPLPLAAVTERVHDGWEALRAEVTHAAAESRFGDLRDRYAERIANSDSAVVRWGLSIYMWAVALPTKAVFAFLDRITDWPERLILAVVLGEVFVWLLTGSLWFPW